MIIQIPGRETLELRTIIFDYNGTLAIDGSIHPEVRQKLLQLAEHFTLYVLTADTYGTAAIECQDLPVTLKTFPAGPVGRQKSSIVKEIGKEHCACIGNGFNDIEMFQESILSVGVLGREGVSARLFSLSDIIVSSICDGIDLFLHPERIVANLRY